MSTTAKKTEAKTPKAPKPVEPPAVEEPTTVTEVIAAPETEVVPAITAEEAPNAGVPEGTPVESREIVTPEPAAEPAPEAAPEEPAVVETTTKVLKADSLGDLPIGTEITGSAKADFFDSSRAGKVFHAKSYKVDDGQVFWDVKVAGQPYGPQRTERLIRFVDEVTFA